MALDVGAIAPDFTLPNQDRQPVTLSQQTARGPVVLAFFPAAFSGTCTQEICTLRDGLADLATLSATIVGVSVDTFFALKAWADAQRVPFPLLSDFNKTVIREYGVVNEDMIGLKEIAKRAVFVIDRDRTIRHREVLDDARLEPDYAAIRSAVGALAAPA
jgi:peroxiredoxin